MSDTSTPNTSKWEKPYDSDNSPFKGVIGRNNSLSETYTTPTGPPVIPALKSLIPNKKEDQEKQQQVQHLPHLLLSPVSVPVSGSVIDTHIPIPVYSGSVVHSETRLQVVHDPDHFQQYFHNGIADEVSKENMNELQLSKENQENTPLNQIIVEKDKTIKDQANEITMKNRIIQNLKDEGKTELKEIVLEKDDMIQKQANKIQKLRNGKKEQKTWLDEIIVEKKEMITKQANEITKKDKKIQIMTTEAFEKNKKEKNQEQIISEKERAIAENLKLHKEILEKDKLIQNAKNKIQVISIEKEEALQQNSQLKANEIAMKNENNQNLIDEGKTELKELVLKKDKRIQKQVNEIQKLKNEVIENGDILEDERNDKKEQRTLLEEKDEIIKKQANEIAVKDRKIQILTDEAIEKHKKAIMCKIVNPPTQVTVIHQQIISGLTEKLTSEGLQLKEDDSGPSVVIAVNNSRILSDVKRDLGKAGLNDGPILLLIIKGTRKLDDKPSVHIQDLEDPRIKEVCFFLVDTKFSTLHQCQINNKSFNSAFNFLKTF
eukprot:GFUD01035037.1.p1 GENE.GFUD01035037.1~~GFUD01035037.1.p1  ORF type:complete len:546 (-),score=174.09 GFUD01035037.1:110-1747(-)